MLCRFIIYQMNLFLTAVDKDKRIKFLSLQIADRSFQPNGYFSGSPGNSGCRPFRIHISLSSPQSYIYIVPHNKSGPFIPFLNNSTFQFWPINNVLRKRKFNPDPNMRPRGCPLRNWCESQFHGSNRITISFLQLISIIHHKIIEIIISHLRPLVFKSKCSINSLRRSEFINYRNIFFRFNGRYRWCGKLYQHVIEIIISLRIAIRTDIKPHNAAVVIGHATDHGICFFSCIQSWSRIIESVYIRIRKCLILEFIGALRVYTASSNIRHV